MTGQHPTPDETESVSYFSRAQIGNVVSLIETLAQAEHWWSEIPDNGNPAPKEAVRALLDAWKATRFEPAMADIRTFQSEDHSNFTNTNAGTTTLAGELDEILQKIIIIGEEEGWSHDPD